MISIVIPTYGRQENIRKNILMLKKLDEAGIIYEVIFVDDASPDHTSQVIKEVCSENLHVKGIVLAKNAGQQNATLAGIRMAKYPYIVTLDDDLSYDPQSIIALFHEMNKGYDVVYGVAVDKHDQAHRNLGTMAKEFLFYMFLGKPPGLRLTSFRIIDRRIADHLCQDKESKVYLSACILKHTNKIGNMPVTRLTKGDPSNYTVWKLVRLMGQIIIGYTWVRYLFFFSKPVNQYEIKEIYHETSGSGRV